MKINNEEKILDKLLDSYDHYIRAIDKDKEDYLCGYADALGQVILDIGKILGEDNTKPYKFEAYKRVMEFETVEKYKEKYTYRAKDIS